MSRQFRDLVLEAELLLLQFLQQFVVGMGSSYFFMDSLFERGVPRLEGLDPIHEAHRLSSGADPDKENYTPVPPLVDMG
jgi:hypothetical protein